MNLYTIDREMIIRESDIRSIVKKILREKSLENVGSEKSKKDKSFVSPADPAWVCWARQKNDTRGKVGTLAWREDVMNRVWQANGLPADSEEAESVREAAEHYLANNKYDTMFSAEAGYVFDISMPKFLKGIAIVESRMNSTIARGYGKGLMQLTPKAIDQVKILMDKETKKSNQKIDPLSPSSAIPGAAKYVRWLLGRPSVKNPSDALFAYNNGPYTKTKQDPLYANKIMAMIDLIIIYNAQDKGGEQFKGLRKDLSL